jgi:hypothetical protein
MTSSARRKSDFRQAIGLGRETDGLKPRPDFVPTGCPSCPTALVKAFSLREIVVVSQIEGLSQMHRHE